MTQWGRSLYIYYVVALIISPGWQEAFSQVLLDHQPYYIVAFIISPGWHEAFLPSAVWSSAMHWSLGYSSKLQAIFASVIPGEAMKGYMRGMITFPSWLGKNSTRNKNRRLLQEIQLHMRLSWVIVKYFYTPPDSCSFEIALTGPQSSQMISGSRTTATLWTFESFSFSK